MRDTCFFFAAATVAEFRALHRGTVAEARQDFRFGATRGRVTAPGLVFQRLKRLARRSRFRGGGARYGRGGTRRIAGPTLGLRT